MTSLEPEPLLFSLQTTLPSSPRSVFTPVSNGLASDFSFIIFLL